MPLAKKPNHSSTPPPDAAEPTCAELLADLESSSAQTRRAAARGLGTYPEAAANLCAALAAEVVESVREAIFTALIIVGTKAAAEGLIPLLQSEDVGLRNGAIEALKTMPNSSGECLSEIFASSTDVRIFGVEILGALQHPDRQTWLLQVIEADNEINVCATAVEALLDCGDRSAVAPLLQLLARFPDEPFLEFSIQTVLARIEAAA
jgi:HEAT repeat protein